MAVPSGPTSSLLICSFLTVHVARLEPGMGWPFWAGQVNLASGGVRSKELGWERLLNPPEISRHALPAVFKE